MAETLDFNVFEPPTLPLVMRDAERTKIDVIAPIEAVVEELVAVEDKLNAALKSRGMDSIKAVYDLAARVMSYNKQEIHITAEDLRDKYKLNFEMLDWFFPKYFAFLGEVGNAKN